MLLVRFRFRSKGSGGKAGRHEQRKRELSLLHGQAPELINNGSQPMCEDRVP
jgi:hypothetical protein